MADIRITTQYYENYSDAPSYPHWKKKGGHVFVIEEIHEDLLFYLNQDALVNIIKELIEENTDHWKYEYLDHEVDFVGENYSITGDDFCEKLQVFLDNKYKEDEKKN